MKRNHIQEKDSPMESRHSRFWYRMRQLEITIWQRVNRASSRAFGCTPRVGFSSLWQRDEVQKVEVYFGVASGLFSKGYKMRREKDNMPLFGKPNNTAKKGEITESIILAKLVQLGYECLIPWGHDHRYDIAIDDDGKLIRIQCKTARYLEKCGCLEFNTAITYAKVGGKPHVRKGYKGEADYFGVYSPDMSKVYLIPVDDVPIGSKAMLRLHATKNNQQKGVKWAHDYEI